MSFWKKLRDYCALVFKNIRVEKKKKIETSFSNATLIFYP